MAADGHPRLSVVVRSYGRIASLVELLDVLLTQRHDSFEVVVVEQTQDVPDDLAASLAATARDPRVRILRFDPLGGPRARNEGVLAARGSIVVLIDDDDLPLGDTWLSEMEAHFANPKLVGVTCRHVREAGEAMPYASRDIARRKVMRYSRFKTPYTFARFDEDVDAVDWLHGTNSAVRRDIAVAAGRWDEDIANQDEHSFAFRLQAWLRARGDLGLSLAFRKTPPALRRLDTDGGMAKRQSTLEKEIANHARFQHRVIGRYFPELYARHRRLYRAQAFLRVLAWIHDPARKTPLAERWRETVRLIACFDREDARHRL